MKIRIQEPAIDGKANRALIQFLAMSFAVPSRQVSLISGEHTREKRVRIAHPIKIPDVIIM